MSQSYTVVDGDGREASWDHCMVVDDAVVLFQVSPSRLSLEAAFALSCLAFVDLFNATCTCVCSLARIQSGFVLFVHVYTCTCTLPWLYSDHWHT